MKTFTLKVIDKEFNSIQAVTEIKAINRNEALKIARELQRTMFYNMGFKMTKQTEYERNEREIRFLNLENY